MTFSRVAPCLLHATRELFPKLGRTFKAQARTEMPLKTRGKSIRNGENTLLHLILVPHVDATGFFSILTIAFNTDEH